MKADTTEWRLRVSCEVQRISGTDQFDVHWFHKNNENEIIDLCQVEVQETPNRERILLGTQWVDTPFNESMLGEYWCQVIVTSTQPNTHLGKSDTLVIRDPQNYDTLSTCSTVISVPTSKCADGIQSSLSVSSSSSCTNPPITEGVQLSLTESTSSSSRLIPSETTSITTEQVIRASATENMSFSSHDSSDCSSIQKLVTSSSDAYPFSSSSDTPSPSCSPSSSPSSSIVPSQSNSGDNTQLIIMAGSIGGALFLLILILLIIIGVLICIKNGRKNNRKSGLYCTVYKIMNYTTSFIMNSLLTHTHIHIYVHTYMYTYVHNTHIHPHTHINIYVHTHMYTYVHNKTHTPTHIRNVLTHTYNIQIVMDIYFVCLQSGEP